MDLADVERRLDYAAGVMLVDPRLLRRIIKEHRGDTGVVAHGRCYALSRTALEAIATVDAPGLRMAPECEHVILVARPPLREARRLRREELTERVFRAAFHARVHLELELRGRALDEEAVRRRVERIGRTEFEEIRAIFTHDEQLLPPAADREVYVEFAATYLELREFAPELLYTTFPGLDEHERIEEILAEDLDLGAISAQQPIPLTRLAAAVPSLRFAEPAQEISAGRYARLLAAAQDAARRRDHARSALLAVRATRAADSGQRERAQACLRSAVDGLTRRLQAALRGPEAAETPLDEHASEALNILAKRSVGQPRWRAAPEARLLYMLQDAAIAYERPGLIVDAPTWLLSLGRRRAVRPRDATREVRVARILESASKLAGSLGLRSAERAAVTGLTRDAAQRARYIAERAVRPKIRAALRHSKLVAASRPERLAQSKLVQELCDQAIVRGFLSLPQLRDAISRNELKLPDLSRPRELIDGDPLLRADEMLSVALDGIYRRGDAYLRVLQKFSSVPFGTRVGRLLTLYLVVPVLGSFMVLEGVRLIGSSLLVALGFSPIEPFGWPAFAVTAGIILGLIVSESFRIVSRQVLDVTGVILAWIFFRIPRAILGKPLVKKLLAMPVVRAVIRRLIVPAAVGALVFLATPSMDWDTLRFGAAAFAAIVASFAMQTNVGIWLEDWMVEQFAPTWRLFSRRWLPELLRLIGRAFATLMESVDRAIHRIDRALTFTRSRSPIVLGLAAAAGTVWAVASYVIRLYMALLVEPELNPLKHFPVVTVAHKLLLPFLPELLEAANRPLSILGPIVGGAIAAVTVFLLPSVFGFLAWELKENYRLYRGTRAKFIRGARLGPQGETMRELLVPGVHSGTLPKLYERLRRIAQRDEERSRGQSRERRVRLLEERGAGRFREGLRSVQQAVQRFVERELSPALADNPRWKHGPLAVPRVDLSSNRIRVHLVCPRAGQAPCELTFEQLGGRVVATIRQPGFIAELGGEQTTIFENALAVFYHRAEVELTGEQIQHELGEGADYEVTEDGLVVFPEDSHDCELTYRLDVYRPRLLVPKVEGSAAGTWRALDSRRILFGQQRLTWQAYEQAWRAVDEPDAAIPRLLPGPSLLPAARTATTRTASTVCSQLSERAR